MMKTRAETEGRGADIEAETLDTKKIHNNK